MVDVLLSRQSLAPPPRPPVEGVCDYPEGAEGGCDYPGGEEEMVLLWARREEEEEAALIASVGFAQNYTAAAMQLLSLAAVDAVGFNGLKRALSQPKEPYVGILRDVFTRGCRRWAPSCRRTPPSWRRSSPTCPSLPSASSVPPLTTSAPSRTLLRFLGHLLLLRLLPQHLLAGRVRAEKMGVWLRGACQGVVVGR